MKLCPGTKECWPHFYKADTSWTIISILGPIRLCLQRPRGWRVFGWKATWCDSGYSLLPRLSFLLVSSSWVGSPMMGSGFSSSGGCRPRGDRQTEGRKEGESTFGEISSQHSMLFSLDKEVRPRDVASGFMRNCSANSPSFTSQKSIFTIREQKIVHRYFTAEKPF